MSTVMKDRHILARLYREYIKEQALKFFASLVLYLPVVLLQLAQPLIIGAVVDQGFKLKNMQMIWYWSELYLIVVIALCVFELSQLYLLQSFGQRMVKHLREHLFAKMQKIPLSYFDRTPLGRVLTRITNDVESLAEMFYSGAVQIAGDSLFLIGTLIMIFAVNIQLSLFAMLSMPILAIGLALFRRATKSAFLWVRSRLSLLNGFLQEYLSGIAVVQQSIRVNHGLSEFDVHNIDYLNANRRAIFLDAAIFAFVDAMSYVTIALVLLAGGYLRDGGMLQIGVMVAFIEALTRFFMPLRDASNNFSVFQNALVASERIFEFMDLADEENEQGNLTHYHFKKHIKFEKVNFNYNQSQNILKNIDFSIQKNEKIALVGVTGAGKSTISKLLTRLYQVSSGRISIDDVDIRDFSLKNLRQLFSYVPQDVFLFAGTLRDNLRYGRENATDAEILAALCHCQAEYLSMREGGLDAQVKHGGLNFSLGERQLLALTRCLLSNAEIIILDEATAGIDQHTEKLLQKATHELLKNRTAVIVAHRLSTIKDCDRILVLQKGQIIEQGPHAELVNSNGLYARWIGLQG